MASGMQQLNGLRIVLVGKTGVGKSAAGNTILGDEKFDSEISASSVTSECKRVRGTTQGKEVAVIDTPGLYDTTRSNDDILKEIVKCITLSSPGPHVFLVIIQLGRFTDEEQNTVKMIQETFGSESSKYTIALFTHGDRLKKKTIEEFLSGDVKLAEFTDQCRGGYHVFNNNDMENRTQVSELLKKINRMVAINGGGCYTNEMYRKAEEVITEEKRKLEREKRAHDEKTRQELREMAERAARAAIERMPIKSSSRCAIL